MNISPVRPLLSPSAALARLRRAVPGSQDSAWAATPTALHDDRFGLSLAPGLGLLIPKHHPRELVEDADICPVPYGPTWLLGFINVRGLITPVLNLSVLWELPVPAEPVVNLTCLLMLGQGRDAFALPLSQLPNKVRLIHDQRLSQPPPLPPRLLACVSAVYHQDGLWCDWNLEPFLHQMAE